MQMTCLIESKKNDLKVVVNTIEKVCTFPVKITSNKQIKKKLSLDEMETE